MNHYNLLLTSFRSGGQYLDEIERLSAPSNDPKGDERIKEIFEKHSDELIADFLENPTHSLQYRKIGANLRERDSFKAFQSSISFVQKIATALRNNDFKGLEKVCIQLDKDHSSDVHLSSILQNFSHLKLPENMKEMRAISHPLIREYLMAAIINRDRLQISDLKLSKNELKSIGPHLTFLNFEKDMGVNLYGVDIFDNWSEKEIHAFLDTCTNLEILKISSAKIRRLPELPFCKELFCSGCVNLKELPQLPLCEILCCNNCILISQLPDLPLCRELNCSDCKNLRLIPALPCCKILNCTKCALLSQLPKLPLCQILGCSHCKNLKELPDLPLCKILYCSGRREKPSLLKHLPDLPLCEELYCNYSTFTHLPNLPLCKKLSCIFCINLCELPDLPRCEQLNIGDCRSLTQIPNLPLCKKLNCDYCDNLNQLLDLPLCEHLSCLNCTSLSRLPNLPLCIDFNGDGCQNLDLNSLPTRFRIQNRYTLVVRWEELKEDPLGVLLSLENSLVYNRRAPKITILETDGRLAEGLDEGGVFRVFTQRLMESLISSTDSPKQLKLHQTNSGLHMPVLDLSRDIEHQMRGFKVLSALFDYCIRCSNRRSVTIGNIFDRKLFDIITSLSFAELEQLDLNSRELSSDIMLKLMTLFGDESLQKTIAFLRISPKNMTEKQFDNLREIVKIVLDKEEKGPPKIHNTHFSKDERIELVPLLQAYLRESLLQQMNTIDDWFPAVIIAKQMKEQMNNLEEWENLTLRGSSHLDNKIQGIMDKSTLLSKGPDSTIEWDLGGRRNLDTKKVKKTKGYVKTWIQNASTKDLERFSKFIAGSATLSPNKKLTFQLCNRNANFLPTTHTCSFTIELSINYGSQADFDQKLKRALDEVNSSETSNLEAR